MNRYDPKTIEPKWQKIWAETSLYQAQDFGDKPKHYQLEFFPYPSGVSMHVGHVRNYVISDAFARYQRMLGSNVLHPMGWDAFGLPAENEAIKTGLPPRESTDKNIKVFKRQLTQMGLSYDWTREIDSSKPDYYKWTQWQFLLFLKKDLAYKAEAAVNWCPKDKTVLANEQVIKDGDKNVCERCGTEVEKKQLSQWFLKITDYADRLLNDLEELDWPEKIKLMQRNWIGRSLGAEINFPISNSQFSISVFTTRPDTLYGATYMVLAPEHPLVAKLTAESRKSKVESYVKEAQAKNEIERMETERAKTGVFTGAYAINPASKEKVPIWVADYVLMGYGTGAIMAVPAHDQRDLEFARQFDLPVRLVIEPVTGTPQKNPERRESIVAIVEDPKTGKLLSINWGPKHGGHLFVGGGREGDEFFEDAARREVVEETGYTDLELVHQTEAIHHHYFAHSKNVARQIKAIGFHFRLTSHNQNAPKLAADEAGKFSIEWLTPEQAARQVTDPLHRRVFAQFILGQVWTGEGVMINSAKYDDQSSSEAREKITEEFGREKVNYKMRDWLISRQRYWGTPIPIIHCPKDGAVPVPEADLPVELPELKTYQPSEDGRSPLARAQDWVKVTCPKCGGPAERETDTMDTFVDSSWYFLRFTDPQNAKEPFAKDKGEYWMPVDTYVGGAEHAVAHLLFARFWTKVLHDSDLVHFDEPFKSLKNQGIIGGADGRKMGKRYGNFVTPDDIIDKGYGADSLRLYELFIGPYDQNVDWNPSGIDGTKRFLNRVWTLTQAYLEKARDQVSENTTLEAVLATATHKTLKKVTTDLQEFSFNTAVAAQMELVNQMYKIKTDLPLANQAWAENLKLLVQMLSPFAPHITEELWQQLGGEGSVHVQGWPKWDPKLVKEELAQVVVQVNGKVRAQIEIAVDTPEKEVIEAAKKAENVHRHTEGKRVVKTIYVPNKLVNFVVK